MAAALEVSQSQKKGSNIREAAFRHQNLTVEKVEILVRKFDQLRALDLSYNRLDNIPRGLPRALVALDLSFNVFTSVPPSTRLGGLIELKLSNNRIQSIVGLFVAISLEHLDLSNNLINVVEGLESLQHLKTLNLENNNISNDSAIRPLSFNTQLTDLYLAGNPISQLPTYKTIVMSYAVSIRRLDGRLVARPASSTKREGYSEMYNERREIDDGQYGTSLKKRPTKAALSVSADSGYLDASADKAGVLTFDTSTLVKGSGLPWRDPPNPLPRPFRGKQIFDTVPKDQRPVEARMAAMENQLKRTNSAPHLSLMNPLSPSGTGTSNSNLSQQSKPRWQSPHKSYHAAKNRELVERMSYKSSSSTEPRKGTRHGYSMAYSRSEPSTSFRREEPEPDFSDPSMNDYNDDYFDGYGGGRGRDPNPVYTYNSRASARGRSSSPTASLSSPRSRARSRSASPCRYMPSITVDVGYGPQLYHPGIDPSLADLGPGIKPLSPCLENKAAVLRALWNQESQRELDRFDEEEQYKRSTPIVESVDWNRLHYGGAGRSPASLAAGGASPRERSRSTSRGRTRFFAESDDGISNSMMSTASGLRANPNALSPKYRYDGSRTSSRERAPRAVTPRSSRLGGSEYGDESFSFSGAVAGAGSPYARLRRMQEQFEQSQNQNQNENEEVSYQGNENDAHGEYREEEDEDRYYPTNDDRYNDDENRYPPQHHHRQAQTHDDRMPRDRDRDRERDRDNHREDEPPTTMESPASNAYEQLREPTSQSSSQASSPAKSQLSLSDAAMQALAALEKSKDFKEFEKLLGLGAAPEDDGTNAGAPAPGFNAREWGIRMGLNGANPTAAVAEAPDGSLVPMSTENASESDQLKLVMLKLMQRRKESLKQLQEAKGIN